MPSVLVVTPTYQDLLRPETVAAVKALQFKGRVEWQVLTHNPYTPPDMRNVLEQYKHAWQLFMAGDYDAMLTVEHDMVIPPHALQTLWDAGKAVTYGVYLLRHGSLVLNTYEYIGDSSKNMGESLSIRHKAQRTSGLVRVSGVGFGCTLIRRAVLERLPFNDGGDVGQSPDVPFAADCLHAGIEQWAHFDVLCGHIDNGQELMPFVDDIAAERTAVATQTMNVLVDRQSVPIVAGRTYTFPATAVMELMRAGYMRPVKDDHAPIHGSANESVQAPADAGRQPKKLAKTNRRRLDTNATR